MPYYLYRISPARILTPLEEFADYRAARDRARALRASPEELGGDTVRMVFAQNPAEAEALLKTRKDRILREDD
jgi:hypothetical protein